ncbi:P-loop NTPase family protein [Roseomonas marmotae]|uniref:AAA+ ATPase domain-containing protein n=1 Tax=Roseomonas marmotae TaxID=2768161 RepID=A0ABS3KA00_9PROT|nr:hypothetical protein [Roseomonas marmotae]MBO1073847.1 hypothetical protein [Roseomonas marmotae]QTI78524.1 hypothetical protein IAI58_12680 [Roseomonas marmotae]
MVVEPNSVPQPTGGPPAVAHAAWVAARHDILEAFKAGEHLVALLGPPGIGKSRLLLEVEEALRSPERRVLRLENGDWVEAASAPQLLLVDEADRMDEGRLRQLAQRGVGFTLLAGLPALDERLEGLPCRRVQLGPMPIRDIPAYVAARMAEVELQPGRLAPGTVEALAEAAGGVPRLLNLLIGTSFFVADMAAAETVRPEHVREAAALRSEMFEDEDGVGPAAVLPGIDEASMEAGPPAPPLASPPFAPPPVAPPPVAPPPAEAPHAEPPPAAPPVAEHPVPPAPPAAPPPSLARLQAPPAPPPAGLLPSAPPARAARRARRMALLGLIVLLAGGALAWAAFRDHGAPPPEEAPMAMIPAVDPAASPAAPELAPPDEATAVATAEAPVPPGSSEAPADPAAPRANLPTGAMVRVIITYPRGAAGASNRATALAGELERAGLAASAPFPVSQPPAAPQLNYFFREDREAALKVQQVGAAQLGQAQPRLGSVTSALPRPGAIELGLPAAAAAGGAPAAATAPTEDAGQAIAPAPATLTGPADDAVVLAEVARRGFVLSWRPALEVRSFVEVVGLEPDGSAREVFAGYSEAADQQAVRLSQPGRYAWRVLSVSREAQRYSASPWHFLQIEASP